MNKNLQKLKELTDALPHFPDPLDTTNDGFAEYKMENGECFAKCIHRSGNEVSVHRWFVTGGTTIQNHTHAEKEWLILYQGEMKIMVDGVENLITVGNMSYIPAHTIHKGFFPVDTKYVSITIPASKEFPNGRA